RLDPPVPFGVEPYRAGTPERGTGAPEGPPVAGLVALFSEAAPQRRLCQFSPEWGRNVRFVKVCGEMFRPEADRRPAHSPVWGRPHPLRRRTRFRQVFAEQ